MIGRKFHVVETALFTSLTFLSACQKAGNEEPNLLTYTLTPILTEDGGNSLQIELRLIGDEDGKTEVQLGQRWADERQPEDRFRDIAVVGDEASIYQGETNQTRIIEHAPLSPLTITYRLYEKDARNDPHDNQFFYAPVIRSNLIQIVGLTSLIVPREPKDQTGTWQANARIEWKNLPETWARVESSSAAKDAPQPIGSFLRSAIIAGDFPVIEKPIGAKTLSVVVPGQQSFQSEELADNLAIILNALNENWDDEPTDYTVSLLSLDLGVAISSFTGTALEHAFLAAGTGNVDLEVLMGFLTHEVTHDWIPRRVGQFPDEQTDIYWFSEGFTDYYAFTLLRREGLLSSAEFIYKTNENLREYYQSTAVNANSEDIRRGFWNSPDIERQPYLRGFLIASEWDKEIRSKSNNKESLNSALRDLKAKAEKSETGLPVLTNAYLGEHFTPWIGRDAVVDIQRFYTDGQTIEPSEDLFGNCATKKLVPVYSYDLGFDPGGSIGADTIVGLDPKSHAYKAGMRDHFRFVDKVSGGGGDTTQPIVLSLADGDRLFEISYFPRGDASINVPQFFHNEASDVAENCKDPSE